eukprot:GHVS01101556.1.p1 GENE.GHVS01101556.1~~GHVS01101556.1.p1  ORF type:complete len:525 (-),score=25.37 GHVS01101556.1:223-1767(-)
MVPTSFAGRYLLVSLSLTALLVYARHPDPGTNNNDKIAGLLGLEGKVALSFSNADQPFTGSRVSINLNLARLSGVGVDDVRNVQVVSFVDADAVGFDSWLTSKPTVVSRQVNGKTRHIVILESDVKRYAIEFKEGDTMPWPVVDVAEIKGPGNNVPELAGELCARMDEANRVKCVAAINNGRSITPSYDGETGALGDLYLGQCLFMSPITIAFCEEHYWQAGVVEEIITAGTGSVVLRLFGSFDIIILIDQGDNAVWWDPCLENHRHVISAICHDNKATYEQKEALLATFGDVKRRFNINAVTGQSVTFVAPERGADRMVSVTDKNETYRIPFEVEATHWERYAVYVYLKQAEWSRVLISFSFDQEFSSVMLDRISLVNPQQRIAKFLFPDQPSTNVPLQQKLYGMLFEGISDGSEGNYNFIISRDDVISLVHWSSTGQCLKIDSLQECVVDQLRVLSYLILNLIRRNPSLELLAAGFHYTDGDLRSTHMLYNNREAVDCGGGDILGIDRLFYH